MIGIIGLILAIAFMVIGAYKGLGALPLTILAALIVILTNQMPIWDSYSKFYMGGYTGTYTGYFLIFIFSGLYAKFMDTSGSTTAIGYKLIDWFGKKRVILVSVLITSVLTYGGVSLFVCIFAVGPIMFLLFKEANLPRHLTIGVLTIGAATYTMTALPGTPQLTNVIPTQFLGTTMTAAPVLGILCSIGLFVLCMIYITFEEKRAVARGEVWSYPAGINPATYEVRDRSVLPAAWKAFLPMIALIMFIIIGSKYIASSAMLTVCAMLIGAVLAFILNVDKFKGVDMKKMIGTGLGDGISAIGGLAAVVAFGTTVRCIRYHRSECSRICFRYSMGRERQSASVLDGYLLNRRYFRYHRFFLRRPENHFSNAGTELYCFGLQPERPAQIVRSCRRQPGHPAPRFRPVPDVRLSGSDT